MNEDMPSVTETSLTRNPLAYHASFDGQHGQALRDAAGTVWFLADDGSVVLLHNADAPHLTLFGRVDIAREQRLLDDLHGGLYQLVNVRNSHRARQAA